MKNTMHEVSQWFAFLDRRFLFSSIFLMVALLGYLDYLSGFEYSFSLFYILPVSLAAWFISKRCAVILSLLCAISWYVTNTLADQTFSNPFIRYWNTLIRFGLFVVVTLLITAMKRALIRETEIASTDNLTGLMNTRAFYQRATTELLRARRYQRPFTLAYIDIDDFKTINDQQGHISGDMVLRTVANTMRNRLRSTDLIARIGGDEFVAFLPETGFKPGSMVITKLQEALLKAMERHNWKVTFSTGAVAFYKYDIHLKDVIQAADQLMYQAKADGKNTVRFDTVE